MIAEMTVEALSVNLVERQLLDIFTDAAKYVDKVMVRSAENQSINFIVITQVARVMTSRYNFRKK